jgi:hypothetical protein
VSTAENPTTPAQAAAQLSSAAESPVQIDAASDEHLTDLTVSDDEAFVDGKLCGFKITHCL